MSTVGDLVTRAYRVDNIIPVGDAPSSAEMTEGIALFNAFWLALLGFDLGVNLVEWNVPDPQRSASVAAQYPLAPSTANDKPSSIYLYPPANVRIMDKLTAAATVYFPEKPSPGARMAYVDIAGTTYITIHGNGRLIEGTSTTATSQAAANFSSGDEWFYRDDTGTWQLLATLAEDDDSPLPAAFDDLLITGTFLRIAPRHGRMPSPATLGRHAAMLTKAKAKYKQDTAAAGGGTELRSSSQSYGTGFNPLAT